MGTDLTSTDELDELEGAEGTAGIPDDTADGDNASLSSIQQELVKDNVKLAYHLASRYAGSTASQAELEDLTSVAILQLVKCASKYDPERGIPFSNYAGMSIRGQLTTAKAKMAKNNSLFPASMDEPLGAGSEDGDEDGSSRHDTEGDGKNPLAPLLSAENAAELKDVIATLPERERIVLNGLYWERKTLRELQSELGFSHTYIAKIHNDALKALSTKLAKRGVEPMRESALPGCSEDELREDFTRLVSRTFKK